MALFNKILKDWNLNNFYTENKSEFTINFINDSQIIFKGLDDSEKIKSITGITRIWIEEASELSEEDFKQLNLRLRGADNLQMILTFNPIDEQHWIKQNFFDNEFYNEQTSIIKTTYQNNKFIDDTYKNELKRYELYDYEYYRVYALGDWGKLDHGGEFYKKFNPTKNISKDAKYNPELPLHFSFDENVNPYMTCTVWQGSGNSVWQIDEICMAAPQNNLDFVLLEIKQRFIHKKNKLAFIYGDSTSLRRDSRTEIDYNLYTIIEKKLTPEFIVQTRVPRSNPSVSMRGLFINSIFAGQNGYLSILISDSCKISIEDIRNVKQASDGTKLKEKAVNPKTGIPYEKYGHCSDSAEYFICKYFETEYRTFSGTSIKMLR